MLIKNNKPNLRGFGDELTLKPGVNDVPAEVWQKVVAKYGGNLQRLLDDGIVEVVEEAGAPIDAAGLATLTERKAVKLVKDTVDEDLLLTWHETEKRKPVVAAIEAQLDVLAKAGEPAKGKGG